MTTGAWGPARREVDVPDAKTSRVLVVPESINAGWVAHTSTGDRLKPLAVNGWQQAWVVPAGTSGTITLSFAPNSLYRIGLAGGLALLPLLALLAWWPQRRRSTDPAARPWTPGLWAAVPVLAAGAVIAGVAGVVVFAAALGLRWVLRTSPQRRDSVTLWLSAEWIDPGRRGAVPPPVAIGRRVRRPFRRSAAAGADFPCRTGRLNRDACR